MNEAIQMTLAAIPPGLAVEIFEDGLWLEGWCLVGRGQEDRDKLRVAPSSTTSSEPERELTPIVLHSSGRKVYTVRPPAEGKICNLAKPKRQKAVDVWHELRKGWEEAERFGGRADRDQQPPQHKSVWSDHSWPLANTKGRSFLEKGLKVRQGLSWTPFGNKWTARPVNGEIIGEVEDTDDGQRYQPGCPPPAAPQVKC